MAVETPVGPRPDAALRRNPRVADQVLDGKAVVLHYEGRRIVGLNETGTVVWSLLDGSRSLRDVAQAIASGRDVTPAQALGDVTAFAGQLLARGLLVDAADAAR